MERGHLAFKQSGTTRMTISKQFDNLDRVTNFLSSPLPVGPAFVFGYTYNDGNQRATVSLADDSVENGNQ